MRPPATVLAATVQYIDGTIIQQQTLHISSMQTGGSGSVFPENNIQSGLVFSKTYIQTGSSESVFPEKIYRMDRFFLKKYTDWQF